MQQLREYQFSKTVAFVRGTRIRQSSSLRVSKLAVFFSRAILAAENKRSLKCNSWTKYQFWKLLHWCAECAYVNRRVCEWANSQCFSAAIF